ncbi:hypothetical protein Droror1_Dr00011912 [Drosera rotundifolia]
MRRWWGDSDDGDGLCDVGNVATMGHAERQEAATAEASDGDSDVEGRAHCSAAKDFDEEEEEVSEGGIERLGNV